MVGNRREIREELIDLKILKLQFKDFTLKILVPKDFTLKILMHKDFALKSVHIDS